MSYAIVFILALLGFAFALLPLFKRRGETGDTRRETQGAGSGGLQSPVSGLWSQQEEGELRELLAERDALYRAIRELDFDFRCGHLSLEDYQASRRGYEAKAASILARLDELEQKVPQDWRLKTGDRDRGLQRVSRRWSPGLRRPAILILATLLFSAGLLGGYLLARPPRGEGGRPSSPSTMEALKLQLDRNPQDLQALLDLAHLHLDQGEFGQAIEAYKKALAIDPQNVEAITHLGIILTHSPHPERALPVFDKALEIDPNYPHALWDKARLLYEVQQDYQGAIETWERFIKVSPSSPDAERARELIQEARRQLQEKRGPAAKGPGALK